VGTREFSAFVSSFCSCYPSRIHSFHFSHGLPLLGSFLLPNTVFAGICLCYLHCLSSSDSAYTYMYLSVHTCMYTQAYMQSYASSHIDQYAYISIYICACVCACLYVCVHATLHIYICVSDIYKICIDRKNPAKTRGLALANRFMQYLSARVYACARRYCASAQLGAHKKLHSLSGTRLKLGRKWQAFVEQSARPPIR